MKMSKNQSQRKIDESKVAMSMVQFNEKHSGMLVSAEDVRNLLSQTSLRSMTRAEQNYENDDLISLLDNRDAHNSTEESAEDSAAYEETSSVEEEQTEEDEEDDEEEEDEEEKDNEEDDEVASTDSEEAFLKLQKEYELKLQRQQRIELYLTLCKDYLYLRKKNYFLQNKLYQLSVRKGIITEAKQKETARKRKGRMATTPRHATNVQMVTISPDEDSSPTEKLDKLQNSRHSVTSRSTHISAISSKCEEIREGQLTIKYEKAVRRIWQMERLREDIAGGKNDGLLELKVKKEEVEKECMLYFDQLMDHVRSCSKEAINSYTGDHLPSIETENFIQEMGKIFNKLRRSVNQFYLNWHGLNYELKRLEEAELESQGEGLQAIEYEQLCGENATLKDKLEYGQLELDKAKTKISHSIFILVHFKEKQKAFMQSIAIHQASLDSLKTRIIQLSEVMERVTDRFEVLQDEKKRLESQSEIIDNVKLMSDFRKTSEEVKALRNEYNKLVDQARYKSMEIKHIQEHITSIEHHLPELRQQVANELKSCWSINMGNNNANATKKDAVSPSRLELEKEMAKLRLLELLEHRTVEPWHETREKLLLSGICSPRFASHTVTTIPV